MFSPENKPACPGCPDCGGRGQVLVGETMKECRRMYYRRLSKRLGPEIGMAPVVESNVLYQLGPEPRTPPTVDKTAKNVFLKGWWGDLLGYLRWAFTLKFGDAGLEGFYFQVVTDERLKNVWFSRESAQARSKRQRDEGATYNSLSDLIGSSYHLVIIRLGFLGYKNAAMAGIFKEALMIRQAANLPTWIVEEPDSLFGQGHFSWNLEVDDYIRHRFEVIDLTKERDVQIVPRGVEGSPIQSDEGMAVESETPARQVVSMPESRFKAEHTIDENDPRLVGGGRSKPKKRGGRGGPV